MTSVNRSSTKAELSSKNAHLSLAVNGEDAEVSFAPYKTLLEILREDMGLMGTKHGCELGECGACAVLLDGEPVLSCLVLGIECQGRAVVTVEGIDAGGKLHPLQEAFADLGAAQCGYCTPGILLTAKCLLDAHPNPTRAQIQEALSGNLCRCTGYLQIFEAVEAAIVKIGENASEAKPRQDMGTESSRPELEVKSPKAPRSADPQAGVELAESPRDETLQPGDQRPGRCTDPAGVAVAGQEPAR